MRGLSHTFILALRNLLRHTGRSAMTLAAIAFGVVALILTAGFIEDTVVEVGESMIRSSSGHLQVNRDGYAAYGAQKPDDYLIRAPEPLRARLAQTPGVDEVMLRMAFSGLLGNGRADTSVFGEGVEPAREERLSTYMTVAAGRHLREDDHYGIMLGAGVARTLKVGPGDPVSLLVNTTDGAANALEFEVVGVFQTFSKDYDARAVRIPLAAAQELMDAAGAHTAVLLLGKTDDTDRVAQALGPVLREAGMESRTWVQLNPFYTQTVALYRQQFGFLTGIILVMLVLTVANTVNMSAFERMGEFGTMMALGNRPGQVQALILVEGAVMGVFGALIGALLGVPLAWLISWIGIPMPPPPNADMGYISKILVVPDAVLAAMAVGALAAALASIPAARRISRTPICDALRQAV